MVLMLVLSAVSLAATFLLPKLLGKKDEATASTAKTATSSVAPSALDDFDGPEDTAPKAPEPVVARPKAAAPTANVAGLYADFTREHKALAELLKDPKTTPFEKQQAYQRYQQAFEAYNATRR